MRRRGEKPTPGAENGRQVFQEQLPTRGVPVPMLCIAIVVAFSAGWVTNERMTSRDAVAAVDSQSSVDASDWVNEATRRTVDASMQTNVINVGSVKPELATETTTTTSTEAKFATVTAESATVTAEQDIEPSKADDGVTPQNGQTNSVLREWAELFHPITLDTGVLKLVFQDLPPEYFGSLSRIAQTGRSVQGRLLDEVDVPKALIKEFRALRKGSGGITPPALSWLWKQLGDAVREGDEPFREFFSKIIVSVGLLDTVDRVLTEEGYTNLHLAVMAGDASVVNALLLAGANVNVRTAPPDEMTPLHLALDRWSDQQQRGHNKPCTRHDFHTIVMHLSSWSSLDVAAVDGRGRGLVFTAVAVRHFDGAEAILRRSPIPAALVNSQLTRRNYTALHTAADSSTMLVTGAKWTTWHRPERDAGGSGCIHNAVKQYNITKAKVLKVPARHHHQRATASTINRWNKRFVELMIRFGGAVDAVNAEGATALHIAASLGNVDAVVTLLRANANASTTDTHGNRPGDSARHAGFAALAEMLDVWAGALPKSVRRRQTHSRARPVDPSGGWGPARSAALLPGEDLSVATCDFDVRKNLTVDQFRDEYWAKGRPVLIQGGLAELSEEQLLTWQRKRFTQKFGDVKLKVARVRSNQTAETFNATLLEYSRYVDSHSGKLARGFSNASQSSQMIVEARWSVTEALHRSIINLLRPPSAAGYLETVAGPHGWQLHNYQLNCGAPMCGTQLHYHFATMSALLHGAKRWVLYPPSDAFFSSAHFKEDYEQILSGRLGSPLQCTQLGGDVLFLPSLWGHGALYEEVSISVSFLYDYEH